MVLWPIRARILFELFYKEKYQLWDYLFIQHQILQTTKVNIIWQTVRRITNAILGVKGLSWLLLQNLNSQDLDG